MRAVTSIILYLYLAEEAQISERRDSQSRGATYDLNQFFSSSNVCGISRAGLYYSTGRKQATRVSYRDEIASLVPAIPTHAAWFTV